MIEKSNINFIIDKSKTEGVADMTNQVFPSHFLGLICGKPGSGKTSLLKFIMTSENLLFKKFDFVYIISPSYKEYSKFYLPNKNFCAELDWNWIAEKIVHASREASYTNVLFILDDVLSDLYKNSRSKEIMDFIFNRRHLIPNGMISILLTSQKYKFVPTSIRSNITMLIAFKLNKIDWKHIKEEIIFSDASFEDVKNYVFGGGDEHNFIVYRVDTNTFFKNFDKLII